MKPKHTPNILIQNEKTIIFCATQDHALAVRDLINQMKKKQRSKLLRKGNGK